ncbi:MAG: Cytosolic copper metallochaperone [Trizodia sp. TS-e1964]|nr:MAG: Cytosolic copper metallochaperone [Trizodia sp. TS-e1964]
MSAFRKFENRISAIPPSPPKRRGSAPLIIAVYKTLQTRSLPVQIPQLANLPSRRKLPLRTFSITLPFTPKMDHEYKFNIVMSCSGCSGAVERVLKRLDGVKAYDVSLETQTATVTAAETLDFGTVLKTIKKTGKAVNKGEADGVEMDINE